MEASRPLRNTTHNALGWARSWEFFGKKKILLIYSLLIQCILNLGFSIQKGIGFSEIFP